MSKIKTAKINDLNSGINNKFGFDQWGKRKYRENIYTGCYNSCRYCGVRKTQCDRLKRRSHDLWYFMEFKREEYEKTITARLERSIFPTAHDIFPFNRMICFKFLERLINPQKDVFNKVLVVSKPRLSVFQSFCERFADLKENILLRFTITTQNSNLIDYWEENASKFKERFECLKLCYEKEFPVSVSIEPYLDTPQNLFSLVDKLSNYVSDTIWIGHMNRIPTIKTLKLKNAPEQEINQAKRIREISSVKNLKLIVQELRNYKIIRYKESFLNKDKIRPLIPSYQLPKLKF